MILLFRFVLVMVLSAFRRRIDPLGESVVHFTVFPTDCDLNFHLNAGRFVSFFDISRVELLGRMRMFRKVIGRGWRPMITGVVVRYRRSLLPFERFTVRSRVIGWDEKWFYFEHVIERHGQMCAIAHARGLFRGAGTNVPPSDFLALAGIAGTPSPELPPFVHAWHDAEELR